MDALKAIVLARGLGTRMQQADAGVALPDSQARMADAGLKVMMPVGTATDSAGAATPRPFLDYVLDALGRAGFRDVAIVIAPGHSPIRRRYTDDLIPQRMRLSWLIQAEPRGTADAVLTSSAWVGRDGFVVVNGDNLYPIDVLHALRELDEPGLAAFARDELVRSGNIPAERAASFALIQTDAEGYLTGILEKPGAAMMATAGGNALVSMNCWRFDPRILDACRDVPRSPRGEQELPMAVGLALTRGVRFRALPAQGEVIDLSQRADVASVSRRLAGRVPRL